MMAHNYFGRFDMHVRVGVLIGLFFSLVGYTSFVNAEPVNQELKVEVIIESAINSWTESILPEIEPMDEQIFTEISPLIDSPESIRLPEDQLTD